METKFVSSLVLNVWILLFSGISWRASSQVVVYSGSCPVHICVGCAWCFASCFNVISVLSVANFCCLTAGVTWPVCGPGLAQSLINTRLLDVLFMFGLQTRYQDIKPDIVWRVQLLTGRRPMRCLSAGAIACIALCKSAPMAMDNTRHRRLSCRVACLLAADWYLLIVSIHNSAWRSG